MNEHSAHYKLPDLRYDFSALEPVINAEIMRLHYEKHHQAYVNNLNAALEKYHSAESKKDMATALSLQESIRFNGGGHINHTIFWSILCPEKEALGQPSPKMREHLIKDFGSVAAFQEIFQKKTTAIQGSGWGWLGYNKNLKRLEIAWLSNQDPLSTKNLVPLFGIDVWEHAYYLQYKNKRNDYVQAIWRILDWKSIEERLINAI